MTEIKFDPIGDEKRFRELNPAYDEARRREEEEKQRYLEPIIEYFVRLEDEVAKMPIAARFRTDKKPNLEVSATPYHPSLTELNEDEFKRATIMGNLLAAKNKAMSLIGDIESIVMDIEATKRD